MSERAIQKVKFEELDLSGKVEYIVAERRPSPELVIYEPTVEFLDSEDELTREEKGKVIAMGDRTAMSYRNLKKQVIEDRNKPPVELEGETLDATSAFYLQYALAARSTKEIAHTSILEQVNVGPGQLDGDPPIVIEGVSVLSGLRDVCSLPHFAFEAFSSRGGIFPEGYYRVPRELSETKVGANLKAINQEVYERYLYFTKRGLEYYLQITPRRAGERLWQYRWRILNLALDDARQVTNQTFLNHFAMHPNSALSLREGIVKLASSELPETREIADRLRVLAESGLPTLMRYTEASPFTSSLPKRKFVIAANLGLPRLPNKRGEIGESRLLNAEITPNADRVFLAAFLSREQDLSFPEVLKTLSEIDDQSTADYISSVFEGMELHDKPPDELRAVRIRADMEMTVGGIFETIRHRPVLHLVSGFTPNHGFTIPSSYYEMDLVKTYRETMALNERGYELVTSLGSEYERVFGPYFVARGHLEPITLDMNGLDAFHIFKIRADLGAHPDIRKPMYETQTFTEGSAEVFRHLVKKN